MIYTIGYSNRSIGEFSRQLERRGITHIVDVRSSPWSRNPHFSRDRLRRWAEMSGLLYRWEGVVLGGRSAFAVDSQPYRDALARLIASGTNEQIAIMCAEGEPEHCHRCYDVGAAMLSFFDVPTFNIRRDGTVEGVSDTLQRVQTSSMHPTLRNLVGQLRIGESAETLGFSF